MPIARRLTIGELRYRKRPSIQTARQWSTEFSMNMLRSVWSGIDQLSHDLREVDVTQAEDDLERGITELLEPRIRRFISDHSPYYLQHSTAERERRSVAPAQPPLYDLAFVFWEDETFKWPLEAKVLKSDNVSAVTEYVKCLREKFLQFKYAPFSSEAAMLGYLLAGEPDTAFNSIAEKAECELTPHPAFSGRHHRTSDHRRTVPPDKIESYPEELRCHHLLMSMK